MSNALTAMLRAPGIAVTLALLGAGCSGASAPTPDPWVARPDGLGPLRAGMPLAQAGRLLQDTLRATYEVFETCDHVTSERLPAGVRLMVMRDTVVRVEVDSATVATAEGARVGDSEASVLERYRGRVRVEPHEYTAPEGNYLVVEAPGDTLHRIVFETLNGRVTEYRVGRRPEVELIEGCA